MAASKKPSVLSFGEILWDVFPDGRRPGGAPLNVAFHLHRLGLKPLVISAVGRDPAGDDLLKAMKKSGLAITGVARVEAPTGEVVVHLEKGGGVHYHIARPAAWEAIPLTDGLAQLVFEARAFVYGSLAADTPANQRVLDFVLSMSGALKVMDVNLRKGVTPKVVMEYASRADVVKCNLEELALLSGQALAPRAAAKAVGEAAHALAKKIQVPRIVVTLGARGALLWDNGAVTTAPAPKITPVDPVGAGDAFTAALVQGLLEERPAKALLAAACARGAWVASQAGAQPTGEPPA